MAKWAYDLTGAEPILRDMPLYDASTIVQGEFVMLGTTDPDNAADEATSFVSAYNATEANAAIDALGICNETLTTSSSPSIAAAYSTTTGPCYGKCIINPFAVYRAQHSTAAADDVAITSTSTTTLTVANLQDDIDGCWAYFPLTANGVAGSLRFITAAASGSCTMDSALDTTGNSSDTVVIISAPNHYAPMMATDATKFVSENADDTLYACTNIRIVQTLCDVGGGIEMMRPNKHYALDGLNNCNGGAGPKFYYDVILKDHIFGPQES